MEKSIWKKPNFEVETFVPNNYIAVCYFDLTETGNLYGWIWEDVDHDGELDYSGSWTVNGDMIEGYQPNNDDFYWARNTKQTLTRPSQEILHVRKVSFQKNAVIFSETGSPSDLQSFHAIRVDVEGESEMIFYTTRDQNNS